VSWVFHCGAEGVYDRKSTAGAAGALTPDQCCPTIAALSRHLRLHQRGPPLTGPTFGTAGPMAPSQISSAPSTGLPVVGPIPWRAPAHGRKSTTREVLPR